jgi:hypothetical protein
MGELLGRAPGQWADSHGARRFIMQGKPVQNTISRASRADSAASL